MTPRDFIYWLKGYFEIPELDKPIVLSSQQVEVIRRHLSMLPAARYNRNVVCMPTYGKDFCDWLSHYLKASDTELSESATLRIQQRLDELFVHVADEKHSGATNMGG